MGIVSITMSSCKDNLNLAPLNDVTANVVYKNLTGYQLGLAKVYGSFALTGNTGPNGKSDIVGLDEGSNADYLRTFWKAPMLNVKLSSKPEEV